MASNLKRSTFIAVMALSLIGLMPSSAVAVTNWSTGCSETANSNYVCNFSDRDFAGVWGHWAGSDSNYSGQNYNSGTSITVNDTTSSVMNLYSNKDVTWHHEPNQGGDGFSINPNIAASRVGLFHNDAFSSHQVAVDNSAC